MVFQNKNLKAFCDELTKITKSKVKHLTKLFETDYLFAEVWFKEMEEEDIEEKVLKARVVLLYKKKAPRVT